MTWFDHKKRKMRSPLPIPHECAITKDGIQTSETRYFISSLQVDAAEIARAIRGHWRVESYHWHLDVTFREDDDHTL